MKIAAISSSSLSVLFLAFPCSSSQALKCPKFCQEKPWHRVCIALECTDPLQDTLWRFDCPLVCLDNKRQHKLCVYTGCAEKLGYRTAWLDEKDLVRKQEEGKAKLLQIEAELEAEVTQEDEDVLFDFLAPPKVKKNLDRFDPEYDDDDDTETQRRLGYTKPRVICDQSLFSQPICAYRSNIYTGRDKKYSQRNAKADRFITTFWFFDSDSGSSSSSLNGDYPAYEGYKGIRYTPEGDLLFVQGTDDASFVERTPNHGLTTEVVVNNDGCTARVTFGSSSLNCSSCSVCSGDRFNATVSVSCSNIDHGVDTECQPLRETVVYPFDSAIFIKNQDGLNNQPESRRIPLCIDALKQQNCLSLDCVHKWMETCTLSDEEPMPVDNTRLLRGSA